MSCLRSSTLWHQRYAVHALVSRTRQRSMHAFCVSREFPERIIAHPLPFARPILPSLRHRNDDRRSPARPQQQQPNDATYHRLCVCPDSLRPSTKVLSVAARKACTVGLSLDRVPWQRFPANPGCPVCLRERRADSRFTRTQGFVPLLHHRRPERLRSRDSIASRTSMRLNYSVRAR